MYVPPQPPAPVPDAARVIVPTVTYPVRRDQHYDSAYDVIADISHILGESRVRLHLMTHQDIEQTWDRMQSITTRFLAAVNYRGNPALPMFPRYPQLFSSSASTGRSYQAPSPSSRPLFPATFYTSFVLRPPVHPPWRMHPLGGPGPRGGAAAPAPQGPAAAPARAPPLVAPTDVPSSSTGATLHTAYVSSGGTPDSTLEDQTGGFDDFDLDDFNFFHGVPTQEELGGRS